MFYLTLSSGFNPISAGTGITVPSVATLVSMFYIMYIMCMWTAMQVAYSSHVTNVWPMYDEL